MSKNHKYLKPKAPMATNQKTIIILSAAIAVVVLLIALVLLSIGKKVPAPTEPTEVIETTEAPTTEPPTEAPTETTDPTEPEREMLPHMKELYEQNPDVVGWIRVDGTKLDYPVMYVPEDEERYLHANFEGKSDYAGLPFIDKDCTMDPESQNLIIYGHNMTNGKAFRALMYYQMQNFYEEHPTIYFSTLYEEREYEIVTCFFDRVYKKQETCFKFYQFIDPANEEEFNVGRDYFKNHNLQDTGVEIEYGDELITLVTCAYHVDNGRFVVVARRIDNKPAQETEVSQN